MLIMHLSSASPMGGGGGPRADVGALSTDRHVCLFGVLYNKYISTF